MGYPIFRGEFAKLASYETIPRVNSTQAFTSSLRSDHKLPDLPTDELRTALAAERDREEDARSAIGALWPLLGVRHRQGGYGASVVNKSLLAKHALDIDFYPRLVGFTSPKIEGL